MASFTQKHEGKGFRYSGLNRGEVIDQGVIYTETRRERFQKEWSEKTGVLSEKTGVLSEKTGVLSSGCTVSDQGFHCIIFPVICREEWVRNGRYCGVS